MSSKRSALLERSNGKATQLPTITKIDYLAKAWADDDMLQEGLWHCCFGAFTKEVDWESEYEQQAMEKLKFEYLEDEQAQREGSNQRGNKGCIARLANKVKRDIMKTINRKAAKTHGTILVSGCAPEIFGEYDNRKTKYKKRKGNSDFNFKRYVINVLLSLFCHTHYNLMVDFSIPKQKTTGERFARNHQEN
jgi:hypothetical protein